MDTEYFKWSLTPFLSAMPRNQGMCQCMSLLGRAEVSTHAKMEIQHTKNYATLQYILTSTKIIEKKQESEQFV